VSGVLRVDAELVRRWLCSFASCSNPTETFNTCWASCKNVAGRSNSYYYSLSLCYENLCYVWQHHLVMAVSLGVLVLALLL
jgi:hypothetical protein